MSIKTILVPLDGNEPVDKLLDTALIIAGRFGSQISAMHVSENTLQSYNYVSNLSKSLKNSVIDEENAQLNAVTEKIYQQLQAYCDGHDLKLSTDKDRSSDTTSVRWIHEKGPVNETLINFARLNDVTLMNRPERQRSILRRGQALTTTEVIMIKSGRPVLLVPPQWSARKCNHAVIAWNQSHESTRAIAMTIPWLTQMEKVSIVIAQSRQASGEKLTDYLACHGIDAEIQILNRKSITAGKRLLQLCNEINGDFLVMGAYGAARIEQYLFGGVTDHVMNNSQVITVMVH